MILDKKNFGLVCSSMIEDVLDIKSNNMYLNIIKGRPSNNGITISAIYDQVTNRSLCAQTEMTCYTQGMVFQFCAESCIDPTKIELHIGKLNVFQSTLDAILCIKDDCDFIYPLS